MKFSIISCGIFVVMMSAGFSGFAEDNPSIRDGMPCLKEICVGDDVLSISGIQWEDAVSLIKLNPLKRRKASQSDIDFVNNNFRGDKMSISRLASYGSLGWKTDIDAYALQQLRGISAFCGSVTFSLRYRSESGYSTTVLAEPVPIASLKEHKLIVKLISREYPKGLSIAQEKQLDDDIKGKYKAVRERAQTDRNSPYVTWGSSSTGAPALVLSIGTPSDLYRDRKNLLKMHPECDGTKSIKID